MDDDIARAIALSIETAKHEKHRTSHNGTSHDGDLELAIRLSKQDYQHSQQTLPVPSKKRKGSIIEIHSSDEDDMDPDLKLTIQGRQTSNYSHLLDFKN